MRCPNCETPYSYRNGAYHPNCRCNETDDNDIVDPVFVVETVIDIVETIAESYEDSDSFDNE